jgi:DNA-binding NtrC family response regulator
MSETSTDLKKSFHNLGDLAERLRFSMVDGHIWLDTQRVALIHIATLGGLRRELIDSLGTSEARGVLTRMGYASGSRDADIARKLNPHQPRVDAFLTGPKLRLLQGVLRMEPIKVEADVASGHFYGEFTWNESFEVDSQIADYGISGTPVCWMEVGYASGYASTFMGSSIVFREVECRGMGATRCRIVGKPSDEWEDAAAERAALRPMLSRRSSEPTPEVTAENEETRRIFEHLVGASSGFVATCHMIRKVARTNATVLFLGETGVGKEMFANALHQASDRVNRPFVAVNCAAIPDTLIESELFGVEKGAYTGALQSRPGRFERAHQGTLFLDEVGTLSEPAQIKLLRAIQEKCIERVGDTTTRQADVRIVAATNVDLREAVREGKFRDDLMFRLNVFPIRIPPLRERRDDIPLLMTYFVDKYAKMHGKRVSGFTPKAIDGLYAYDYPGNIRELENLIERAVILVEADEPIDIGHLFADQEQLPSLMMKLNEAGALQESLANVDTAGMLGDQTSMLDLMINRGEGLSDLEEQLIRSAVDRCNGNLAGAARMLGITRPQMEYRVKKLQLD